MSCCGPRYYCSAAGPVAVNPDADGWYVVPEGGTSGWYKTAAEALETCPYTLSCGDQPPISAPAAVRQVITDVGGTGCDEATFNNFDGKIYLWPATDGFMSGDWIGTYLEAPFEGNSFILRFGGCGYGWALTIGCDPDAPDPTRPYYVLASNFYCGTAIVSVTPAAGWTDEGSAWWWAVRKYFSAAEWDGGAVLYGPVVTLEVTPVSAFSCMTFDGLFTLGLAAW